MPNQETNPAQDLRYAECRNKSFFEATFVLGAELTDSNNKKRENRQHQVGERPVNTFDTGGGSKSFAVATDTGVACG